MEYRLPENFLGGHLATFPMLDPDVNPEQFSGKTWKSRAPDDTLRLSAMEMPPHAFVLADNKTGSFTTYGPLFSIAFEVAKKLNYSMVVDYLDGASAAEIIIRAFSFVPDLVVSPASPALTNVLNGIKGGIMEFNGLVGVFEMDHILSKRETSMNYLKILSVLSCQVWIGMFISLAVMLVKTIFIKMFQAKRHSFVGKYPSFFDIVLYLLECFFASPDFPDSNSNSWRVSALFWTIGTLLLKLLVSGDLITQMTIGPQLDPIDTFSDLATKNPQTKITAFASLVDDMESVRTHYFSKDIPGHEQLNKRIELLEMEKMNDNKIVGEMLRDVASGERYHLGFAMTLRYNINNWFNSKYSDSLYISKDYVHHMPAFLTVFKAASCKIKNAIKVTRDRLSESGIYDKWLDYHIGESKLVIEDDETDSITEMKESIFFLIMWLIGCGAGALLFVFEVVYKVCSSKAKAKVMPILEIGIEISAEEQETFNVMIGHVLNESKNQTTSANTIFKEITKEKTSEKINQEPASNLVFAGNSKKRKSSINVLIESLKLDLAEDDSKNRRNSLNKLLESLAMLEM